MDNGASSYRRFCNEGDDSGLVEIIVNYRDGLILYLNSFVGNIHIAEELAEDTFVLLGTKKPKDKGTSSFKTWLYTIGRNIAINHLRRRSRFSLVSVDDCSELESEEESLEAAVIKEEQKISVHRALKKLKPEYHQVLWLIYFENFSNKEAAKIMGNPFTTSRHLSTVPANHLNHNWKRRVSHMKSYDETVDSVFDRIDKYNSEKIRKNKIITKAVVPACCFCLIALGGIVAWKSGLFKSGTPGAVPGQPVTSYDNAAVSPAESTSPNSVGSKRLCFANQINGVKSAAPLYLDPAKHYTENWSNAEVTAYMGADLFNLGAEYKYIGSSSHAVTFSSDGAIARDVINLKYHSKDADFTMSASKLGAPNDCIYALNSSEITSIGVGGKSVEVLFAATVGSDAAAQPEKQNLMVADFSCGGVYYRVTAENISISDFYNIVSAIVKK